VGHPVPSLVHEGSGIVRHPVSGLVQEGSGIAS